MEIWKILSIIILAMSLITFILYAVDKRRAVKGNWRIPEAALLLCSVLCGAIGGTISMYAFHHKTKHWYFVAVNFLFAVLHIGAVVYLFVNGI